MSEAGLMRRILLACSRGSTRLFRNNVGQAWLGRSTRFSRSATVIVQPGDVLVRHAQAVRYGLCEGSSDLIGWRSVTVTPEMVGQTVAVFAAIEVKTRRGRATDGQQTFLEAVQAAGGIGAVVRSEAETEAVLK